MYDNMIIYYCDRLTNIQYKKKIEFRKANEM